MPASPPPPPPPPTGDGGPQPVRPGGVHRLQARAARGEEEQPLIAERPPVRRRRPRPPSSAPGRRRPPLAVVVPALIGAVFGAVATLTWDVRPQARVVEGVIAAIDDRAVVIRLGEPAELSDRGFGIVGALWREAVPDGVVPGEWRRTASDDGHPTCLSPDDAGRTVTLGLVSDPGGADRPASEVVAWLECALPAGDQGS